MNKLYAALSTFILIFYAWSAYRGWEFSSGERYTVSAADRSQPGWYRSPTIWHTGYRGGK